MKTVFPGQQVTLRTNDAYDGAQAVVNRIWSSGDVNVNVDGEDICVQPHEIEGIETHRCERCGATITAHNGHRETYRDYLWDGSDGEGSVLYEFERWTCSDLTACRSHRREQAATNVIIAASQDAVAREGGYGAIRNF